MTKTTRSQAYENAERVWKIMEDAVSYGFNSSHSLSVAYDSLYGAYLKANYPLEYFTSVLNIYESNTEKTDQLHGELEHFGITVINPEFGKSQSKYSFDKSTNQVVKGLKSIKYLNDNVSDALLELSKEKNYTDFIELAKDIKDKTSVDTRQMSILIKLDFFKMYGNAKYLSMVNNKLTERYKKTLKKEETILARLEEVREYANTIRDISDFAINEKVLFEKQTLGYAQSIDTGYTKQFAVVTEINTKYSPLITMYSVVSGKEGNFKMSKANFFDDDKIPRLQVGDLVELSKTEKKPKQQLVNGKWEKTDIMQFWINSWKLVNRVAVQ